MRVLVACSDAGVRDAFLDVLRGADIGVIAVADWAATLELARQQRPDIVLLTTSCLGSAASQACKSWPPKARIRRSWSSPHGSIGKWHARGPSRAPPDTSAREIAAEALPRIVRGVMRGEAAIPRTSPWA
jgi:hypothetical protein